MNQRKNTDYGRVADDWLYDDEAVAAQEKLERAGFTGWQVVVSRADQLQIDWDKRTEHPKMPSNFFQMMRLLVQRFDSKEKSFPYEVSKSKGGGNHIVIHLPETLSDIERVAWQVAFGSDGKREALNLLRIKRKIKNPILLFMPRKVPQ